MSVMCLDSCLCVYRSVVVARADILEVVPMQSDGNCLFAALSVGAKGRHHHHSFTEEQSVHIVARSI